MGYGTGTPKQGEPAHMVQQLTQELERLRSQLAEQEGVIEILRRQAHEDPLTGLLNRRAFERELRKAVSYHQRYGRPGALLLIDMNDFKTINDTLGHLVGDSVLQHIATILQTHVRDTDTVSRIGGDEFCIILREANAYEALLKAAELDNVIRHSPLTVNGRDLSLSVSIGSCAFTKGESKEDVLAKADEAMYQRKAVFHGSGA